MKFKNLYGNFHNDIETDMKFYILENKKVKEVNDCLEWGRWFQNNCNLRQIKREKIGGYLISTVFLGINYGLSKKRPLIFETIVFVENILFKSGLRNEVDVDRCSTYDEALEMHERLVKKYRKKYYLGFFYFSLAFLLICYLVKIFYNFYF